MNARFDEAEAMAHLERIRAEVERDLRTHLEVISPIGDASKRRRAELEARITALDIALDALLRSRR